MSFNWPLTTIDEIKSEGKGSIAIGPFGSRMKSDCYVTDGIPVIRGTNIAAGPTFDGEFVYITKEKAKELGSSNVYKNDLVFPHRGSIGEVGIIEEDKHFVLSSSLMKLTCDQKKVNPKFLYYFFKSRFGRHELLKNASQVGTPGIGQPLASLKGISLRLPPLNIQNIIEEVLSSLDKKISLNTKANQTLEQIAQAIFKSWFVDFDPVKAKIAALNSLSLGERAGVRAHELAELAAMSVISGKDEAQLAQLKIQDADAYQQLAQTAALFPAATQESELGEIPEGWELARLENILELVYGKALGKTEREEGEIPVYGSGGLTGWHNKKLTNGPGIIVGRKGTVGSIYWERKDFFAIDTVFFVRTKNEIPLSYAFYLLQTLGLEDMNTDAAVPGLNRNNAYRLEIVGAPSKLILEFSKVADSLRMEIDLLKDQSDNLSKLRDSLLPKLLSGEINLANPQKHPHPNPLPKGEGIGECL